MGGVSLPPGFRFHPTDEELVDYYLKRKADGLKIELEVIPVIDLYKFDPWELPDKSFLPKRDMEWFFFCPRDRKYPNGSRSNRATRAGYWKATGKDRKIVCQSSVTGFRKTLVFYRGRAPLGDRTDWVMYEYRLCDDLSQGSSSFQGAFALCRVVKKNEQSQKMSDLNGEPKAKRVGSSSTIGDFTPRNFSSEILSTSDENPSQATNLYNGSNYSSSVTSPYETTMVEFEPTSTVINHASFCVSPDLILDSSKDYQQGKEAVCESHLQQELPNWISSCQSYDPNFEDQVDLCMSPYSGGMNYMDLCGIEDTPYEGFDQNYSLRNLNPSINGFEAWNHAPICRQTSGDGSLGELSSLWLKDDNLVIVI
ncbi:hypothetical protein HHK36_000497 [Tetracentron sinense]|uniref:NAC domain-containing protein n=1 Tax=Tetracentron sinense TaxID=13715 RepID=A0A834ZR59_TETSI|nr:hypothetical protein HHK36_000497 [Tetracentron sinense]